MSNEGEVADAATTRGLMRRLVLLALLLAGAAIAAEPKQVFQQNCASCHGPDRLGLTGPALLPESLERLRKTEALKVIRDGRPATQMAGFAGRLPKGDIEALAEWIYSPVTPPPGWTEADIRASRIVHHEPGSLPDKPVAAFAGVDMMNLFVVVEAGDHHVTILDGDRLEPIARFPSRYALHGGPKFTPNGRFVFFCSRDGWITKYDIWNLQPVAEVRAGLNSRNLAVSDDGRFVAVANYLPSTLVLLDGDLNLVKVIDGADGNRTSRISAVYDAAPRRSFVAALKDIPELWEISYDPKAEPIFNGFVHDYHMAESLSVPGFLNPRRIALDDVLDDFYFNGSYSEVMGASRSGKGQVVNLDVRRKIADLDLPGMPHLGSGITWEWHGRPVMASPNLKEGVVSVIDMKDWHLVKHIPTLGPGFFIRSHEDTPYAWVDAMMSKSKDTLLVIDKRTLEPAAQLKPVPGKTLAHVEFDRYGRYALASVMERKADGGALIVFDAATLKEIKRIPMDKPIGKYNLTNKISRSEGTSH